MEGYGQDMARAGYDGRLKTVPTASTATVGSMLNEQQELIHGANSLLAELENRLIPVLAPSTANEAPAKSIEQTGNLVGWVNQHNRDINDLMRRIKGIIDRIQL